MAIANIENKRLRNEVQRLSDYIDRIKNRQAGYNPRTMERYKDRIILFFTRYLRNYRKEAKRLTKKYKTQLPQMLSYIRQAENFMVTTFERNVIRAFGQAMHSLERALSIQLSVPGMFGLAALMPRRRITLENRKVEGFTRLRKNGVPFTIQLIPYLVMLITTAQAEIVRKIYENITFGMGGDLVYISPHPCWLGPQAKEVCNTWRGRIVSLTGLTDGFPNIREALNEKPPLFHPNCTHLPHPLTREEENLAIAKKIKTIATLKKHII